MLLVWRQKHEARLLKIENELFLDQPRRHCRLEDSSQLAQEMPEISIKT